MCKLCDVVIPSKIDFSTFPIYRDLFNIVCEYQCPLSINNSINFSVMSSTYPRIVAYGTKYCPYSQNALKSIYDTIEYLPRSIDISIVDCTCKINVPESIIGYPTVLYYDRNGINTSQLNGGNGKSWRADPFINWYRTIMTDYIE